MNEKLCSGLRKKEANREIIQGIQQRVGEANTRISKAGERKRKIRERRRSWVTGEKMN